MFSVYFPSGTVSLFSSLFPHSYNSFLFSAFSNFMQESLVEGAVPFLATRVRQDSSQDHNNAEEEDHEANGVDEHGLGRPQTHRR